MKQLVVCRHAKSSWKYAVKDEYRPLNKRGITQAPQMAANCSHSPDLVLCSPAVRAWSTAVCYFQELSWNYEVLKVEPRLIEAPLTMLVNLLRGIPEQNDCVFLFGHNPGFNALIHWLSNEPLQTENLVTSGRVVIALDIKCWSEIDSGLGKVEEWTVPESD